MELVVRVARPMATQHFCGEYRRAAVAQRTQRAGAFRRKSIPANAAAAHARGAVAILVRRYDDEAQERFVVASNAPRPIRSGGAENTRWANCYDAGWRWIGADIRGT